MKRWLNEPLLHFLVLGALLFGVYAWLDQGAPGSRADSAGPLHITANEIAWLKETWVTQRGSEPTREELRDLVLESLKEKLLGREARAMGLDQNDLIIRRRLAQKVEFLVQDAARLTRPTDDDLRRYYETNRGQFQASASVSFAQVFFNAETRSDAAADAKTALAVLSSEAATTSDLGDAFMIGPELRDANMQVVAGHFGRQFADAVFALKPGAWHGPITSTYGLHLVRVTKVEPARQREFSEVEPQVREGLLEEHQREAYERYFAALLKKKRRGCGRERQAAHWFARRVRRASSTVRPENGRTGNIRLK